MRFQIHVNAAWQVSLCWGSRWLTGKHPRQLRQVQTGNLPGGVPFPLPPDDKELAALKQQPHGILCNGEDLRALQTAYDDMTVRRRGDLVQFGRYLFDTLLGQRLWKVIRCIAEAEKAPLIELALCWDSGQRGLHRLPWEMMHDGQNFLAAARPRFVAITRVVTPPAVKLPPAAPPPQIGVPPRVLFVIGSKLADPDIRPGAEYLGLLRQIRSQQGQRAVHTRILHANPERSERKITPTYLLQVIQDFKPDVVYFIGHGGFDASKGHGYLELTLEATDDAGKQEQRRYADKLLECLGAGARLPPIVVLSACYSGTVQGQAAGPPRMLEPADAAPLAAELVAGGVPVVVAMAGRITDSACRLFTRRLGAALVDGEELVRATAQGRLAAFVDRPNLDMSVDWAFPAVFLAGHVPDNYKPVNVDKHECEWVHEQRIKAYKLLHAPPVFCAREDFFEDYYDLFQPARRPVLMIYTSGEKRKVGRRRLLHELVAQAIRDGHAPCLVRPEGGLEPEGNDPEAAENPPLGKYPQNAGQFGVAVLKAIQKTRALFNLDAPVQSMLLNLLHDVGVLPDLDVWRVKHAKIPALLFEDVYKLCENLPKNKLTAGQVRVALHEDLTQLTNDLQPKGGPAPKPKRRAIVFLEAVERYGAELTQGLLNILGDETAAGLGKAEVIERDAAVPVVMTFARRGPADALWPLIEAEEKKGVLAVRELRPFDRNSGEELLACERVLLFPCKQTASLYKDVSGKAWAFNANVPPEVLPAVRMMFNFYLGGLPNKFNTRDFYLAAEAAYESKYLLPAKGEKILEKILNGDLTPLEDGP
jgi:hypothetical protein